MIKYTDLLKKYLHNKHFSSSVAIRFELEEFITFLENSMSEEQGLEYHEFKDLIVSFCLRKPEEEQKAA